MPLIDFLNFMDYSFEPTDKGTLLVIDLQSGETRCECKNCSEIIDNLKNDYLIHIRNIADCKGMDVLDLVMESGMISDMIYCMKNPEEFSLELY